MVRSNCMENIKLSKHAVLTILLMAFSGQAFALNFFAPKSYDDGGGSESDSGSAGGSASGRAASSGLVQSSMQASAAQSPEFTDAKTILNTRIAELIDLKWQLDRHIKIKDFSKPAILVVPGLTALALLMASTRVLKIPSYKVIGNSEDPFVKDLVERLSARYLKNIIARTGAVGIVTVVAVNAYNEYQINALRDAISEKINEINGAVIQMN
jgi:hypothetical protein